jgi:hypothetical protein
LRKRQKEEEEEERGKRGGERGAAAAAAAVGGKDEIFRQSQIPPGPRRLRPRGARCLPSKDASYIRDEKGGVRMGDQGFSEGEKRWERERGEGGRGYEETPVSSPGVHVVHHQLPINCKYIQQIIHE